MIAKTPKERLSHTISEDGQGIETTAFHGAINFHDCPKTLNQANRLRELAARRDGLRTLREQKFASAPNRTSAIESEVHVIDSQGIVDPEVAQLIIGHPEIAHIPKEHEKNYQTIKNDLIELIKNYPKSISPRLIVKDDRGNLDPEATFNKISSDKETNLLKNLIGVVMPELCKGQVEQASPLVIHKKGNSKGYLLLHLMQHVFDCKVSDIAASQNRAVISCATLPTRLDPSYSDLDKVNAKGRYLELIKALAEKPGSYFHFQTKGPNGESIKIKIEEKPIEGDFDSNKRQLYERMLVFEWGSNKVTLDALTLTSECANTSAQGHGSGLEYLKLQPNHSKTRLSNEILEIERSPKDAYKIEHNIQDIAGIFEIICSVGSPIIHGRLSSIQSTRPFNFAATTHTQLMGKGVRDSYLNDPLGDFEPLVRPDAVVLSASDKTIPGWQANGFRYTRGADSKTQDKRLKNTLLATKESWPDTRGCTGIKRQVEEIDAAGQMNPAYVEHKEENFLLRWIETRECGNLPTSTDRNANKVYRDGLSLALQEYFLEKKVKFDGTSDELEQYFPYETLKNARDKAYVSGMKARIPWLFGEEIDAAEFALKELIPRARRLLKLNGANAKAVDPYMDIIELRHTLKMAPADIIADYFNQAVAKICKKNNITEQELYIVDKKNFEDEDGTLNEKELNAEKDKRNKLLIKVLVLVTQQLRRTNALDRRMHRYYPNSDYKGKQKPRGVSYIERHLRKRLRDIDIEKKGISEKHKGKNAEKKKTALKEESLKIRIHLKKLTKHVSLRYLDSKDPSKSS